MTANLLDVRREPRSRPRGPRASTLVWLGSLAILAGLALLVAGFFLSDPKSSYHSAFYSYLVTNLGGLLVFTASYTLLSEGLLRKGLTQEMADLVDLRLDSSAKDASIAEACLSEIRPFFSSQELHEKILSSQAVKMIVVKNTIYFREYCESLRERIEEGRLSLEILTPDPEDAALMDVISRRYDEFEGDALPGSIVSSEKTWIQRKVFDKLSENRQGDLRVYTSCRSVLYSAYLFDRGEIWYIPYSSRVGRHQVPIFVFRDFDESLPIWRDILDLFRTARQVAMKSGDETSPTRAE